MRVVDRGSLHLSNSAPTTTYTIQLRMFSRGGTTISFPFNPAVGIGKYGRFGNAENPLHLLRRKVFQRTGVPEVVQHFIGDDGFLFGLQLNEDDPHIIGEGAESTRKFQELLAASRLPEQSEQFAQDGLLVSGAPVVDLILVVETGLVWRALRSGTANKRIKLEMMETLVRLQKIVGIDCLGGAQVVVDELVALWGDLVANSREVRMRAADVLVEIFTDHNGKQDVRQLLGDEIFPNGPLREMTAASEETKDQHGTSFKIREGETNTSYLVDSMLKLVGENSGACTTESATPTREAALATLVGVADSGL